MGTDVGKTPDGIITGEQHWFAHKTLHVFERENAVLSQLTLVSSEVPAIRESTYYF
jgi:hypothetical protein